MLRYTYQDQHDVAVIDWPAMSPDINPIEHVCGQMSIWNRDMDRPPSNLAELRRTIREAWQAVRAGRVCRAARGGHY